MFQFIIGRFKKCFTLSYNKGGITTTVVVSTQPKNKSETGIVLQIEVQLKNVSKCHLDNDNDTV